LAALLGSPKL
jgi:hypothetical protein